MKKVVFAKQCDYDIDIIPLWYDWYTKVFVADEIIITPIILPNTPYEKTYNFYKGKDVSIRPIEMHYWDAQKVGVKQLEILDLDPEGYIIASADSDMFLEPLDNLEDFKDFKGAIKFNQQRLVSDGTIYYAGSYRPMGIFCNTLESKNIEGTGHFIANDDKWIDSGKDFFHFDIRGYEWFENKFSNIMFDGVTAGSSHHWKLRQRELKNNNGQTVFNKIINEAKDKHQEIDNVEKFKNYLEREYASL